MNRYAAAMPLVFVILSVNCASRAQVASAPTTQATSRPAVVTTAPAAASQPDAAVLKILNNLEEAGQKYRTIKAGVDYHVDMVQTGDEESRNGYVAYQGDDDKSPAKFRVSFDKFRQAQGPWIAQKLDYVFDGQWLWAVKHNVKQATKYQVAAEGEKVEPYKLGQGPFPLPFGQKADDMIKHFEAATRPLRDGEPKGTIYLKLIPRKDRRDEFGFVRLEMWIDPATYLPMKIVSEDKSENITTVTFNGVETGKQVDPKLFTYQAPLDYNLHVKRLNEN